MEFMKRFYSLAKVFYLFQKMFKSYLADKLSFNWFFGLSLILFFGIIRFATVLYGIQTGNNQYLPLIFGAMILIPFAILSKSGRIFIKIKKPKNLSSLLLAIILGAAICYLIFLLGRFLYGNTLSNWFQYIGESYPVDLYTIPVAEKQTFFIVFVIIGMTFSPFGEELFYRGLVHGSFVKDWGESKAALIDSAAFGITHLAHFGLIYTGLKWDFYVLPAIIWMFLMFVTGLVFNYCKWMADSILGAILSHMAFNGLMTYLIFFQLF